MKLSKNQLEDRMVDLLRSANSEDINSAVEQAKNRLGMLDKKEWEMYKVGDKIRVMEDGKMADEAVVRSVGTGGYPEKPEVKLESLKVSPGKIFEFALFDTEKGEWLWIFPDPMTGRRCFSQRGPSYTFELISQQ